MVGYQAIAHLARPLAVEPSHIDLEFVSDCGEFRQIITVARATPGTPERRWLKRIVTATLKRVMGAPPRQAEIEREEFESLVLQGFEQVRPSLRNQDGRWVHCKSDRRAADLFDRQLRTNPIVDPYDIQVLVRVLLEISRSDSEFRSEEKTFLEEIVCDDETIAKLSKAPNITVAELAETSSVEARETILMLAWAMAYADGRLDLEEMRRLSHLCKGFSLSDARVKELQMAAKLFLLDRHFNAAKGKLSLLELQQNFEEKAKEWFLDDRQLQTLRDWYPAELG